MSMCFNFDDDDDSVWHEETAHELEVRKQREEWAWKQLNAIFDCDDQVLEALSRE